MNRGLLYASAAFVLWGTFPIYFKLLAAVPAPAILAYRIALSMLFLLLVLAVRHQWRWLRETLRRPRVLGTFALSATLLSTNWGVYIWAVNAGHVVDSSLGYFITPLANVLLGSIFLKESLRPLQWAAIVIAAIGVLWLGLQAGRVPWIGLVLAASFSSYGLIRKTASLGALEGLTLETLLLFPLALAYLVWASTLQTGNLADADTSTWLLLASTGPITALPLLMFAAAARRISFSQLGIMQYISPTLQLLLGVWLYREPFDGAKLAGYSCIWFAVLVYTLEGVWRMRRAPEPVAVPTP